MSFNNQQWARFSHLQGTQSTVWSPHSCQHEAHIEEFLILMSKIAPFIQCGSCWGWPSACTHKSTAHCLAAAETVYYPRPQGCAIHEWL